VSWNTSINGYTVPSPFTFTFTDKNTEVVGKPTVNENMNVAGLTDVSPTVMAPTLWSE